MGDDGGRGRRGSWAFPFRLLVYTAAILVAGLMLKRTAIAEGLPAFRENGPLEWFQWGLVAIAALVYTVAGSCASRERRLPLQLLAVLSLMICVRELDDFFDKLIPAAGWQLPAALLALGGAALVWRSRGRAVADVLRFIPERPAIFYWTGCAVLLYAQMVGHGGFMEPLFGEHYIYDHKRVVEESMELKAYVLIGAGSVEGLSLARDATRSGDSPNAATPV